MTLQQMQYIIAVDTYRHFVRAAEACGVTQSTLSTMIHNLEDELDAVIFDRSSHPVVPTAIGEKIIAQARVVLHNAGQLAEIPANEKGSIAGNITLGIIPTVSPYILPQLFMGMRSHQEVSLRVIEARTDNLIGRLHRAEMDMAILATPLNDPSILEVPLYYEKFYAYISPGDPLFRKEEISPESLPGENLWVLQEGHCFRQQIENFCSRNTRHSMTYESGSIDTLIKVVDSCGGHTIIPELHLDFLNARQKANVRKITSPEPVREISVVFRNDFVKERLLNMVTDIIRNGIREDMVDSRLRKFSVRI